MGESISFVGKEYQSNLYEQFSFKIIVLEHLKKILWLASREMRGGYWMHKSKLTTGGVTQSEKVYIPDTREEYSNAINALHDLLLPHFDDDSNDGEIASVSKQINYELEKMRKEFIEKTAKQESEVLSAENYEGDDKKLLEEYKHQVLRKERQLFQALSCFIKRMDYFETTGMIQ